MAEGLKQYRESYENRVVIVTICVFSLIHFAVLSARAPLLAGLDERATATLGERIVVMTVTGLICYGLVVVFRANRDLSVSKRVALGAFLSVPAALGVALLSYLFYSYRFNDNSDFTVEKLDSFLMGSLYWFWYLIAWCGIYLAISYSFEVRDREERLAAAHSLAHEAQLRALRYQVNPHFLFNSLNSIASLIADGKNRIAEDMLLTMSDFFRTSLSTDPLEDSMLKAEVRLQETYLAVEKLRFQDRLVFEIILPRAIETALIPSLLLQPLLENAIKHGVALSDGPVRIAIRAWAKGPRLHLAIENDAPNGPNELQGLGIGLKNVRDRLVTRFGEAAQFRVVRKPGRFNVELEFPLIRRLG